MREKSIPESIKSIVKLHFLNLISAVVIFNEVIKRSGIYNSEAEDNMKTFTIIAGIASIISLIMAFIAKKYIFKTKIENTINDSSKKSIKQSIKGDGNIQIGGNGNVEQKTN